MRKLQKILISLFAISIFSFPIYAQVTDAKINQPPEKLDGKRIFVIYKFFTNLFYFQSQMGLMLGHFHSSQMATFREDFFGSIPKTHAENDYDTGLQVKFLFGEDVNSFRPALTINGEKIFSTNDIINQKIHTVTAKLTLRDDWVIRALIGAESPIFLNQFSAGLGIGVAAVGQSLNAKLATVRLSPLERATFVPTVGTNLTFYFCPNCIFGQGLSITAQVNAEQYPNLSVFGKNSLGNPIEASIIRDWQFTENLIFSVDLC